MAAGPIQERNQDATVYVGGLDEKVNEGLLWELFVQAGPVVSIHMPKDRITTNHQGYGFVEFMGEEDSDYAIKIMNMIKLYGKPIRVNKASAHQKNLDIGANIFVGNLDPEVDEKLIYDTFSAFGIILQVPKIMRDPESGNSKGFAFVNFASFEASDAAIEAMNGQYLCNRPISVSYAFKREAKGERHGTAAERLLAAQNPIFPTDRPHQLFADAPAMPPMPMFPPPPPPAGFPQIPNLMGFMMSSGMPMPPMPPPPPGMMPPPPPMGTSVPPPPRPPPGAVAGIGVGAQQWHAPPPPQPPQFGIGQPPQPPRMPMLPPRPPPTMAPRPPPQMGAKPGGHTFPPPPPPVVGLPRAFPPPPPPPAGIFGNNPSQVPSVIPPRPPPPVPRMPPPPPRPQQ